MEDEVIGRKNRGVGLGHDGPLLRATSMINAFEAIMQRMEDGSERYLTGPMLFGCASVGSIIGVSSLLLLSLLLPGGSHFQDGRRGRRRGHGRAGFLIIINMVRERVHIVTCYRDKKDMMYGVTYLAFGIA